MQPRNPGAILPVLSQRLSAIAVISITALSDSKRPLQVPFLDGSIQLAPGAAILALRAHAPLLLPLAAWVEDGKPVVEISAPLAGTDIETLTYANGLESMVAARPTE